jgi:uncharacterized protein DUF1559
MSFRLWMIFYVFALLASGMAMIGPLGILASIGVLGIWACCSNANNKRKAIRTVLFSALIICVLTALVHSAFSSARVNAHQVACANNLKNIAIAMLNYQDVRKSVPPAFLTDASGKPLHSWRLLLLPYYCGMPLYDQYKFSEPWNGPNNSKLLAAMQWPYPCPNHAHDQDGICTEANYFAVIGPETAWPGGTILQVPTSRRDLPFLVTSRLAPTISDGASNTIMLIEASDRHVQWMEPRDLSMDEAVELLTTKPASGHMQVMDRYLSTTYYQTSGRHVAFWDGLVIYMEQLKDPAVARALLTIAGGEQIPTDLEHVYVEPRTTTIIKWGKIWGLSVFVVLALVPAARMWRREHHLSQN